MFSRFLHRSFSVFYFGLTFVLFFWLLYYTILYYIIYLFIQSFIHSFNIFYSQSRRTDCGSQFCLEKTREHGGTPKLSYAIITNPVFSSSENAPPPIYTTCHQLGSWMSRNTSKNYSPKSVVLLVVRYGLVGVGVGVKPTSGEISFFCLWLNCEYTCCRRRSVLRYF
jgi:hypothetical protein